MHKQCFEGFQENFIVLFNWSRSALLNSKFKVWAFWVLLCCRIAELCVHLLHSQIAFLHCVCFQMYCGIPMKCQQFLAALLWPPSQIARLRGGFGCICLTLLHCGFQMFLGIPMNSNISSKRYWALLAIEHHIYKTEISRSVLDVKFFGILIFSEEAHFICRIFI